jgi:uncharacterized protein YcnI
MNPLSRLRTAVIALLVTVVVSPSSAFAHAVVFPKNSTPGAYEKYVLRVPNEKDVATTRVEIRFPAGLRVVSFSDVAGWRLEELRDSANAVIGAIWTGRLSPERFVEFPFVAVNPKADATLSWPAFQTYEDGERVEWTGAADSERPASVTTIRASDGATPGRLTLYVALLSILLSLTSLGIFLRRAR